ALLVARRRRAEHLERHLAAERAVARAVDGAHAPLADAVEELVARRVAVARAVAGAAAGELGALDELAQVRERRVRQPAHGVLTASSRRPHGVLTASS